MGLGIFRISGAQRFEQTQFLLEVREGCGKIARPLQRQAYVLMRKGQLTTVVGVVRIKPGQFLAKSQATAEILERPR